MSELRAFTDIDRELFLAERTYDIEMAEIAAMEAAIDANLRINLAKCELKVLTESGDASDLAFLVEAAENEAAAQQGGIIARIFAAIGKAFSSLVNGVRNLFTGKSAEEMQKKGVKVSIPKDTEQVIKEAETMVAQAEGPLKKLAGAVGVGATITAAVGAAGTALSVILDKTHVLDNFIKKQKVVSGGKEAAAQSAMNTGDEAYASVVVDAMKAKAHADRLISLGEKVKGLASLAEKGMGNVAKAAGAVKNTVTGKGKEGAPADNKTAPTGTAQSGTPAPAANEQPKQESAEEINDGNLTLEADENAAANGDSQGLSKVKAFFNLIQRGLSKLGNMIMAGWKAAWNKLTGGNKQQDGAAPAGTDNTNAATESAITESASDGDDTEKWDPIQAMLAGLGVNV